MRMSRTTFVCAAAAGWNSYTTRSISAVARGLAQIMCSGVEPPCGQNEREARAGQSSDDTPDRRRIASEDDTHLVRLLGRVRVELAHGAEHLDGRAWIGTYLVQRRRTKLRTERTRGARGSVEHPGPEEDRE